MSHTRDLSKLARTLDTGTSGQVLTSQGGSNFSFADASGGGGTGVVTHANVSAMTSASPAPDAGSLHYTTATNSLYARTTSGFFKLATINTSPSFTSVSQTTDGSTSTINAGGNLELVSGQNTVVTLTGSDAESGSGQTLAYSAATTSGTQADVLASLTQGTGGSINVFTLVPAASGAAGGTISVTFSITDSIDTAQQIASFTLSLIVLNSKYTSLLLNASAAGTNAAFTDSSSSNRTVTVTGNPAQGSFSPYRASALSQNTDLPPYVAATDGGSVSATAAGNYIASTISALGTADFTIECWIYVRSAASYNPILDTREGTGGSTTGIVLGYNGSRQLYVYSGAFIIAASSSSAFSLNTWTHIVLERKSTVMKVGVNGTFGSTSNDTRNLTNTAIQILNDGAADFHDGHIADFKVTSGFNVYNHTNFTPATSFASSSGSNLHLKFTGAKIFDKSQTGNIGLNSAVAVQATSSSTPAQINSGDYANTHIVDCSSATKYVTAPDNGGLSGAFTIETYMYITESLSGISYKGIIGTHPSAGGAGYMAWDSTGSGLDFYAGAGAGHAEPIWTSLTIPQNSWFHFAVQRSATNYFSLYLNGVKQTSGNSLATGGTAASGTVFNNNLNDLYYITRWHSDSYSLSAYLQDFRISDGLERYTTNFTPHTTPLKG